MKKTVHFLIVILLLFSCRKNGSETDPNDPVPPSNGLGGKWEAITHYYSNGSGLNVVQLTAGDRFTVDFKPDSTLYHSPNCPTGHITYDRYNLLTTSTAQIIKVTSTAALLEKRWYYGFEDSTRTRLILSINPGYEPNYYLMKRI